MERQLRTGSPMGRTVYLQLWDAPSAEDVLLGIFDSAAVAALIVAETNRNEWLLNQIAADYGQVGERGGHRAEHH